MQLPVRRNPTDVLAALAIAHNNTRVGQATPFSVIAGQSVLVAGTVTVASQPQIHAGSKVLLMLLTHGGTAGARYKVVPTSTGGGFVLTAVDAAGTTVATDTSTFGWVSVNPTFHSDASANAPTGDNRSLAVGSVLAVSAAAATDLPTSLALAANIDAVYRLHVANGDIHVAEDSARFPANAIPVDLASLQTYLNDVKSKMNAHLADTAKHYVADSSYTITAANASDQSTSNTLANQIKSFLNSHMLVAPGGSSIKLFE